MKRYRLHEYAEGGFPGGGWRTSVVEQADEDPPPAYGVLVPVTTALHDWEPPDPAEAPARSKAGGRAAKTEAE